MINAFRFSALDGTHLIHCTADCTKPATKHDCLLSETVTYPGVAEGLLQGVGHLATQRGLGTSEDNYRLLQTATRPDVAEGLCNGEVHLATRRAAGLRAATDPGVPKLVRVT